MPGGRVSPARWAVDVVVGLEVVDVDQKDGQQGAVANGASPLPAEGFIEQAAVGDAGEAIETSASCSTVLKGVLKLAFGDLALGDIAQDIDKAGRLTGEAVAEEANVGPQARGTWSPS